LTILHPLSLERKANNVLNHNVLHSEGYSNQVAGDWVPRFVEGKYHKIMDASNDVRGPVVKAGDTRCFSIRVRQHRECSLPALLRPLDLSGDAEFPDIYLDLLSVQIREERKTFMLEVRLFTGVRMVARRKVAGLALVITGIIVILTGSVVIAGEETLGTGFIVQVLIGAAIIVEGAVLLVLPRKSP
jgi:hypothetical protein